MPPGRPSKRQRAGWIRLHNRTRARFSPEQTSHCVPRSPPPRPDRQRKIVAGRPTKGKTQQRRILRRWASGLRSDRAKRVRNQPRTAIGAATAAGGVLPLPLPGALPAQAPRAAAVRRAARTTVNFFIVGPFFNEILFINPDVAFSRSHQVRVVQTCNTRRKIRPPGSQKSFAKASWACLAAFEPSLGMPIRQVAAPRLRSRRARRRSTVPEQLGSRTTPAGQKPSSSHASEALRRPGTQQGRLAPALSRNSSRGAARISSPCRPCRPCRHRPWEPARPSWALRRSWLRW